MIPGISSRKSRHSYGIILQYEVASLVDYDKALDEPFRDQVGALVAMRMAWYLTAVCCSHLHVMNDYMI